MSKYVPEGDWSPDQQALYNIMSQISECCFCAGWVMGNEFGIWRAIGTGNLEYGMNAIDPAELAECVRLSATTGGWIAWPDESETAVFIDLKDWKTMVAEPEGEGAHQ